MKSKEPLPHRLLHRFFRERRQGRRYRGRRARRALRQALVLVHVADEFNARADERKLAAFVRPVGDAASRRGRSGSRATGATVETKVLLTGEVSGARDLWISSASEARGFPVGGLLRQQDGVRPLDAGHGLGAASRESVAAPTLVVRASAAVRGVGARGAFVEGFRGPWISRALRRGAAVGPRSCATSDRATSSWRRWTGHRRNLSGWAWMRAILDKPAGRAGGARTGFAEAASDPVRRRRMFAS